ncbi:MAG: hypothetical protein LBR86_08135 [Tannerella sp.]|jgi:hypothetical protein|nr:hypothetical protein [Tannerella sp.]
MPAKDNLKGCMSAGTFAAKEHFVPAFPGRLLQEDHPATGGAARVPGLRVPCGCGAESMPRMFLASPGVGNCLPQCGKFFPDSQVVCHSVADPFRIWKSFATKVFTLPELQRTFATVWQSLSGFENRLPQKFLPFWSFKKRLPQCGKRFPELKIICHNDIFRFGKSKGVCHNVATRSETRGRFATKKYHFIGEQDTDGPDCFTQVCDNLD